MRTVDEVCADIMETNEMKELQDVIRKWAESIIDECAGNWECTMEENLDDPSHNSQQWPVLVRGSVTQIKNKL